METWLRRAAKVGATIQERDRQMGEMVALELLITKNSRLGNQENVDSLLDMLQGVNKELEVTETIINEWFGGDITDLRLLAVEIRVALDKHEDILTDIAVNNRTLEILIAGSVLENDEDLRNQLLSTRDLLVEQLAISVGLLDEMVAGKKEVASEDTAEKNTLEAKTHEE